MNTPMRIIRSVMIVVLLLGSWTYGKAQSNTFPSSGNVGIGTVNPIYNLQIESGRSTLAIIGNANSPSWRARLLLDRVHNYRGAGVWIKASSESELDWYAGVPYTGKGYTIGYHETQPEYKANTKLFIDEGGDLGIGTDKPTAKLSVNGTTKTKEVIVTEQAGDWPDYVFADPEYQLPNLGELEIYIEEFKHLPGIPTKDDIEKEGQYLGVIQAKLLEKIEELTLHTIEQQKRIEALRYSLSSF